MSNKNIKDVNIEAVVCSGENVFDYQREYVQEVFECKIYDDYGNRETTVHANECGHEQGYHIGIENGAMEFLDKDRNNIDEGRGDFIITDFQKLAMPFLRYEVKDSGIATTSKCSCGRNLPLVESIEGRTTDILVSPSGKILLVHFLIMLFTQDLRLKNIKLGKLKSTK